MSFGMFLVAGKRGKRRTCQLRERTADEHAAQTAFRNQRHSERSRGPIAKSWVTLQDRSLVAFYSARNVGGEPRGAHCRERLRWLHPPGFLCRSASCFCRHHLARLGLRPKILSQLPVAIKMK